MPGSAILGTNLVDSLIPGVVDGLRGDLHPLFGVRAFRVYTLRRTYPSGVIGGGIFTDVLTEITPQPLVKPWHLRYDLEPCGLNEAGYVSLSEVSLTYTEAELTGFGEGIALPHGVAWYIKITDAHGQGIEPRYFVIDKPCFPDRIKNIGWNMYLRKVNL